MDQNLTQNVPIAPLEYGMCVFAASTARDGNDHHDYDRSSDARFGFALDRSSSSSSIDQSRANNCRFRVCVIRHNAYSWIHCNYANARSCLSYSIAFSPGDKGSRALNLRPTTGHKHVRTGFRRAHSLTRLRFRCTLQWFADDSSGHAFALIDLRKRATRLHVELNGWGSGCASSQRVLHVYCDSSRLFYGNEVESLFNELDWRFFRKTIKQ